MRPEDRLEFRHAAASDPAVWGAVSEITRTAFLVNPETGKRIEGDTPKELAMVQALRERGAAKALHVALHDGGVAGYVLYTEGTLSGNPGARVLGLTIMGIAPALQRQGIGTRLLRWSVEQLREACDAIFVVGHPAFYPKAGFVPMVQFGIAFPFPAPPEACMIRAVSQRPLLPGTASYHPVVIEFV